ncbi:MAG TPA: putative Ig domain-containing protein, partial [Burkholderiaceae bacterium]
MAHALASGDVQLDGGVMHATVGGTVVLDASGSTDADGDALSFSWTLTAHPAGSQIATSGSGSTLTWKPDVTGVYTYDVVVTDGRGGSTTQSVSVTVDNQAPAASVTVSATFSATPQLAASQPVIVNGRVTIDASATADPDGDPVDVTFDIVAPAGSTATLSVAGRTARFSPDLLGTYVVRVHGTDGRGASFESDYPFDASDRAPISTVAVTPTFTATPLQMPSVPVTVGANIGLDATATTDPDGDPVTVTFELTQPASSTAALSVNGRAAHFSPDVLGAYEVRVRGIDGRGASFETRYPFDANNRAPSPVTVATVTPVVADAGSTVVTTSVGYDVLIDSGASSDPDVADGYLVRNWVLASVPAGSQATLQGAATATSVGLSPDMLGDYVVHLTVTDGQGAQSMRTVIVRANNRRPVAQVTTNATPQSLPSAPSFRVPLGTQVT